MTKEGLKKPNYWGSVTQASTCRIGNFRGEEAYTPFSSLLPMVHPNDIVWGGWDISSLNLAEAMERAQVRTLESLVGCWQLKVHVRIAQLMWGSASLTAYGCPASCGRSTTA